MDRDLFADDKNEDDFSEPDFGDVNNKFRQSTFKLRSTQSNHDSSHDDVFDRPLPNED